MPFPLDWDVVLEFFTFAVLGMGKVESRFRVVRRGLRAQKSDCTPCRLSGPCNLRDPPVIPQYRTLPCDSDDLTDRRIGSAEAFGKHAVKCRRAGRENRGSCSGNERRKAAEAEPRRPEKTESLDFSL
jgi:hypothetical protein